MYDAHGRRIHYLRIALTDRCNLRCRYCMPEHMRFQPNHDRMTTAELLRLAACFADLGFDKFRLTGGEPTLHPDLITIIAHLSALPNRPEVVMTTNGLLLEKLAGPLANAGLHRCNISLDALDEDRFRTIARRGESALVLRGLHAAEKAGLLPIKINTVVLRGLNDADDLVGLAGLTTRHDWQVRFIELMPFGEMADFAQGHIVPENEVRRRIEAVYGPLQTLHQGVLDGEARLYRISGAPGSLGFISAITQPFCAECSRVRLTADGKLRLCLLADGEADLLTPLRAGAGHADLCDLITKAVYAKPIGHWLDHDVIPLNRVMSQIGG